MPLRAQEFFSGSGDFSRNFGSSREELVIINDGNEDLSFIAGATSFTLKPGEVFDEAINPFDSLTITANGSFRGYVREES